MGLPQKQESFGARGVALRTVTVENAVAGRVVVRVSDADCVSVSVIVET
jgi:hypothetical protein